MKHHNKYISLALFLLYYTVGASTIWKRYWLGLKVKDGMCFVDPNHVPGVKEVIISNIKSPAVKLQEATLSTLAFGNAKANEIAGQAIEILDKIKDISSVHPAVDRGVAALGLIHQLAAGGTQEEPTVEDLREATEEAFVKMTERTNKALYEMKDYVDNEFLKLEQGLMKKEYHTLYQGWINCDDYVRTSDIDRCLKNQIDDIRKEKPKFLMFQQEMKSNSWEPTVKELKKLQAGMFVFRDYAQLVLMVLQTMVNYEGKSGVQFKNMLKEEIDDLIQYAESSVNWIKKLHGDPISSKACADTIYCRNVKSSSTITGTCSCKFDLALGDSEACTGDFTLSTSTGNGAYFSMYAPEDSNAVRMLENAAVQWNTMSRNREMNNYFGQKMYHYYMEKTLQKYWDNEILSLIPTWKAMKAETTEQPKKKVEPPKKKTNSLLSQYLANRNKWRSRFGDQRKFRQAERSMPYWEMRGYMSARDNDYQVM